MVDSAPPPSRFGAGYTVGGTPSVSHAASVLPTTSRLNRLAVVTFGAALLFGLVVAPLTLPLSYLAQRQIQASGDSGASLARAAMLISAVYLVVGAVVIGLYVFVAGADAPR